LKALEMAGCGVPAVRSSTHWIIPLQSNIPGGRLIKSPKNSIYALFVLPVIPVT
jgi:hypothetical protein